MRPPSTRVTIAAVADAAGVSVPTVSKVLNGRSDVSADTRERVEEVIRRLGYQRRPRKHASASPVVDLVFSQIESLWAVELIRGVQDEAQRRGAGVVISECGGQRHPRQEWLESVLERKPLGVVLVFSDLTGEQRAQLESRSIPHVVVDPAGDPHGSTPSVGSSHFVGGRLATQHLIELGHRRIAAISGRMDTIAGRSRLAAFRDAMTEAGIGVDEELVRHGAFTTASGLEHGTALLSLPSPPTAIVAGSDLQAIGVYQAAAQTGVRIPRDLSVVGYDGLESTKWLTPQLTTVRQPLRQMGEIATAMVLRAARGETSDAPGVELAVSFVERESTAPPSH